MKVIFMGTPDFSVPALKALISKHEVICVYTQPPRPSGRGQKLTPSPVQKVAEENGILVRYPVSLRNKTEQNLFKMLEADIAVVCAYGLILPIEILTACPNGCINIHASLLPRWRGAAPIQRAIMARDKQTGVTIMQMEAGLDTGDMLLSESVDITPDMTGGLLHDKLSEVGARLILKVLDKYPTPVSQGSSGVTYAKKIEKQEALLNWNELAEDLEAKIRAFNPYPKAYFERDGERISVLKATVKKEKSTLPPGTLLDDDLSVVCGLGTVLSLDVLQRSGKRPLERTEFLRGYPLRKGERL